MLKSISIENFLVIDNLKLDLRKGLTVISGESGAGKSTVIDAICWCLGIENKRTKGLSNAIITIEFPKQKIKRISDKNGKTNFYINGKKVNKKDISSDDLITICRHDNRLSFSLDDDFRYIVDSILYD